MNSHTNDSPRRRREPEVQAQAGAASCRPLILLGAGAVLGMAVATGSILSPMPAGVGKPSGVVALVNGEAIAAADLDRALAAMAADKRAELTAADRRAVLERLIDEELLLQRGLALGLLRHDRRARARLSGAVVSSVVAEAEAREPERPELERFYAANADLFLRPGKIHVRQVFVAAGAARDAEAAAALARTAVARLRAGETYSVVREQLGDREAVAVPDTLVSAAKLEQYLGPTALRAALSLAPGEVADPVRSGPGFRVIEMVAREEPRVPPFGEIEAVVRDAFRRQAGERALRAYLDDMRDLSEIVVDGRFS